MLSHLTNLERRFAGLPAPALMGIVNVTPNSFSDSGAHFAPEAAAGHAEKLVSEGAAILDLGAEASSFFRAGVLPVSAEAQMERLRPVLALMKNCGAMISVDTRSARVAREAIGAGAHIVNDISAGEHDGAMLETVAELGCPIILMRIGPTFPATAEADDPDIVGTVGDYLLARAAAAEGAGILRRNILLDPGLGFGITALDCWRLVTHLGEIAAGYPLVLGVSRKRFLEAMLPQELASIMARLTPDNTSRKPKPEHPRDGATAQVTAWVARNAANVRVHRLHNVACAAAALAAARV